MNVLRALPGAILFALALAAPASFTIRNAPEQEVDADTGIITLTQGGTVEDAGHGFTVQGKYLQLKQNDFLIARDATIATQSAGSIRASSVDYRMKPDRLVAVGPLEYSFQDLKGLTADRAVAYLAAGQVVALGAVQARSPLLEADAAVFDSKKKEVFLYGRYRYEKLSSNNPDKALLLSLAKGADKPTVVTRVPDAVRAAYLELIERSRK